MRRQREIDFPAKQYDDHDSHAAEKQMTTPRKLAESDNADNHVV